ncbi:IS3 family transposase [Planococcus sp. 11815]|uniref:IS3 family transposase n=1 Tax=Planococcus sp. 11815 TaxID=2939413 RepID=UPI003DA2FDFA
MDRTEFKNARIGTLLKKHHIERLLSQKGNTYDNAFAEVTFKMLKMKLPNDMCFNMLNQLAFELFDYVNWYNHVGLPSSLGHTILSLIETGNSTHIQTAFLREDSQ